MKKLIFLSILAVLFVGCGKQRLNRSAPATPKSFFGTNVADTNVEILTNPPNLKASTVVDGSEVTVTTKDWLELSGRFIEIGNILGDADGNRLMKNGEDLAKKFYDLPYSHTIMTATSQPIGNPYLDVASTEAKPILIQKWSEAIDNVKTKVAASAGQTSVVLGDLPVSPLPETLIQRVIDGLNFFKTSLHNAEDGNGDAIIDQIVGTIDKDYITGLQILRDASKIDGSRPLSVSLKKIGTTLSGLTEISDSQRQRLLVSVNWGISLAKRTEALVVGQDAIAHLVDFWLNDYYRAMFPASLKNVFMNMSDKEILALSTSNKSALFGNVEWQKIKIRTDYIMMPDLEIVGQYVQNNGTMLNAVDWNRIKNNQFQQIEKLLQIKEVQDLVDLLSVNEKVTSDEEKRAVLVNNWLGLSNRLSFPDELKKAFAMFDDSDLKLLKSDEKTFSDTLWLAITGHPKIAFAHYKILEGINTFGAAHGQTVSAAQGLNNFRVYFQNKIIVAMRLRMDNAVLPIAKNLGSELSGTLLPLLEKQKDSGPTIADESFNVYSRYYMGKLVFGVQGLVKEPIDSNHVVGDNAILAKYPLPILEKDAVKFSVKDGVFQNRPVDDQTSAQTLGVALTNSFYRLETLTQTEGVQANSPQAVGLNFQSIAKMLAIAGYKGADSQLEECLNVSMTAGHESNLLDIHNYNPGQIIFATPDQIYIKNQYKLDAKSTQSPRVSVQGQMSLLRGYAQMMHFFKPWEKSAFDDGLGALRIDEAPALKAFDKQDFFLLGIGLSSIILENIPLKMMGLITDDGKLVESGSVADPSQVAATGAVLANYDRQKMSHLISTRDVALSIEAVADFYQEVKDLEKTEDPTLISALKSNPPSAIRAQLAKLLSGMVLFSTGRLMALDGGFAHSYDGDLGKASDLPRVLEDQLLMERALLTAGKVLESNFILARAADNFFFLNGHFWESQLGFYREGEKKGDGISVKLNNVSIALENLLELDGLLPQMTRGNTAASLDQMQKLKGLWLSRFFSAEILKGSPVSQVSEYSL